MKKLLMLLLLMMTSTALGENALPPVEYLNEQLVMNLPGGGRFVVYVYDQSGYIGYRETADGWARDFDSHLLDELRHLRLDDADVPAYSLVSEDGTQALHYRWQDDRFVITGWKNADWDVALDGETLVFTGKDGQVEPFHWPISSGCGAIRTCRKRPMRRAACMPSAKGAPPRWQMASPCMAMAAPAADGTPGRGMPA